MFFIPELIKVKGDHPQPLLKNRRGAKCKNLTGQRWIHVTDVQYLGSYRLKVVFDDGAEKVVDFKDELWGEIYEPLNDVELFKQVSINPDFGVLCWPNGADIASDTLYEIGIDVELYRPRKHLDF